MFDGKAFGSEIVEITKAFVQRALSPILERLDALEKRLNESLPSRPVPADIDAIVAAAVEKALAAGAAAVLKIDADTVKAAVAEAIEEALAVEDEKLASTIVAEVAKQVAELPAPQDGKSVTMEEMAPLLDDLVSGAMATLRMPRDGRDVDPEAIKAMVDEAVNALPRAQEIDREELAGLVSTEVERAVTALPKPTDGASVTIEDVRPLVDELVAAKVAEIPVPRDGKDVDPAAVRELVVAEVQKAVEALPAPKDGKDVDPETVAESISTSVAAALEAWPRPQDGKSVTIGELRPIVDEVVGNAVAALPVPKDGVGVAGALKDHEGALVLTLTDGTLAKLGRVDGEKGKDGLDGIGADDFEMIDAGDAVIHRLKVGERVKEWTIPKTTMADMHKGVWKEGAYPRGAIVTWGGSQWLAKTDTTAKPETTDDWVLVVKRGRDGKDGVLLEPREPAKVKLK